MFLCPKFLSSLFSIFFALAWNNFPRGDTALLWLRGSAVSNIGKPLTAPYRDNPFSHTAAKIWTPTPNTATQEERLYRCLLRGFSSTQKCAWSQSASFLQGTNADFIPYTIFCFHKASEKIFILLWNVWTFVKFSWNLPM